MNWTLLAGMVVIAAAALAVFRRVDVRLVLMLAAVALGALAGQLPVILREFFDKFTSGQYIVPICCSMGFAHVLRQTGCDQHLVQLLVKPLRRARVFLIPGAVLVGFTVNLPIISQASTVVAIGSVLVPLLRAAGISTTTIGAALLLGASLGGELLNPGAPELNTVANALAIDPSACVRAVARIIFLHLGVATALFWIVSWRAEARSMGDELAAKAEPNGDRAGRTEFRVNLWKAMVPLVPVVLLFLCSLPGMQLFEVPRGWLVKDEADRAFSYRLIGAAMLVGTAIAALSNWHVAGGSARAFFEGAGYAFTNIVSLIVTATCFGKGVELIGLQNLFSQAVAASPVSLLVSASLVSGGFAFLSGSGMAATQSVFGFFVEPARLLEVNAVDVGAVVSISAAAGRTMSPISAVCLMCASLTGADPLHLARRVALPLLAGLIAMVLLAIVLATA